MFIVVSELHKVLWFTGFVALKLLIGAESEKDNSGPDAFYPFQK